MMRNEMEYRYRECMNPSVLETGITPKMDA